MDIQDLRGLGTLVVAIAFIGMSLWVFSSKRTAGFEEARLAPFADEPLPGPFTQQLAKEQLAKERPAPKKPVVRSNQP